MTTCLIRSKLTLVLVLATAALALPGLALAGTSPGKPLPDWFERYAAAHPYSRDKTAPPQTRQPDWFERYAVAHPFGHRLFAGANAPEARRAIAKPGGVFFVDDWFRDASTAVKARHTTVKLRSALFVDDWFRDPS